MMLRLRLKFLVTLLTINSHRGRHSQRVIITKRQNGYVYQRELVVNSVTRNLNHLRFIQIPSK